MPLVFDLETNGLLPEVTEIHCLVIYDPLTDVYDSYTGFKITEGVNRLMAADELIGHNILGYDLQVIEKLYYQEYAGKVTDTILCSRLIWSDIFPIDACKFMGVIPGKLMGAHSLEAWGYRLGELKGDYGKKVDAWEVFTPDMLTYCIQDVKITKLLWEKIKSKEYSQQAIDLEHDFARIVQAQERHGFLFDKTKAIELYTKLSKRRLELQDECTKVFPGWHTDMKKPEYYWLNDTLDHADLKFPTKGAALAYCKENKIPKEHAVPGPLAKKHTAFNPGSRDHISRALIEKYAWQPKEFTKEGKPKIDEEVLKDLVYPEAKVLTEFLLVGKRIGQVAEGDNAWLKLEKQGRIYGRVITNGAATGRCTHSNPNMAQVPSCGAPYGAECRDLFTVPKGYKLVGWDASGLELRCLAHYMARYDGGAYTKVLLEGDVHTINQMAAGLDTRDAAKKFIYVYLYGGQDGAIASAVGVGRGRAAVLRKEFLKKTPALAKLQEDVQAVARQGFIRGLDGRTLPIRSKHAALNTLLQGAGALICKQALIFLNKHLEELGWSIGREWAPVVNVHDEVQAEVREDLCDTYGKLAIQSLQEAGEHFKFRCPITGEYKIGNSWKETH